MALYTNNFKGRAGRRERAKHLVDEFKAIEDAFTRLQALNISTYLTTHVNTLQLSGTITIRPDNGFLQELTLTEDTAIGVAPPLNESQFRVTLLIHGSKYKVTNLWGAQTWKEYGQGNWFELYCGEGPYASMLLDFFWDICSNTWICVASSKNQFNTLAGGTEQRFYPLLCNLSNVEGDDTLGFTRASPGQTIDHRESYHYLPSNVPRFHGVRYVENWCPTAYDLTSPAWIDTNCTVTTDAGAGPIGQDVERLAFTATGGKLACYLLPSFGRASTAADSIKVAVSFLGRGVSTDQSVRVVASFCGKTNLDPPVHDIVQVSMDTTWQTYGAVLDITKEGNATYPMALDRAYPKTLMEIAFMSPSGSTGGDIQITDVQIQILRWTDDELPTPAEKSLIGASMTLSGTGTGLWVDGTKTMTLASVGQSIDFGGNLETGKTYLVHPRLQSGSACDIRMQNDVTVWAAGLPSDDLYVQDAPFTFQYDGGVLKFVLMAGISAVYLIDIYEVSNNRGVYCYENEYSIEAGGALVASVENPVAVQSGTLDGVAREIASTNQIPYVFFRTFSAWDQSGLTGVDAAACRNPVYQSEYGIDGWPSRATLLQGASRVTDGFIQRLFTIPQVSGAQDFTMWIRRTLDVDGTPLYTPQFNDVNVPVSRYVDFEAELVGGLSDISSGRVRLDIQNISFVGATSNPNYTLRIHKWDNWYHIVISLTNDGTHNQFRVRVYPASANDPDPAVIDVTQQGWVVIDWAQFENKGGTFFGSSPIIGGATRALEDFTSGLPDGDFYETTIVMSLSQDGHVAALTTGDVIWDRDDGVYKNLLYSTTTMLADPNVRNMHEFGLVDAQDAPLSNLTVITTTLYPIEAIEQLQLAADINDDCALSSIPLEQHQTSSDLLAVRMPQILISYGPDDEQHEISSDVLAIRMPLILLSYGPDDEQHQNSADLLAIRMPLKLVTVDTPDEKLQLALDVTPSDCSLTPV